MFTGPSRLARFLLLSIAWLLVLMWPWYQLSAYLSAPVIALAGQVMQTLFGWVAGVERQGTVGVLLTHLNVLVPQGGRLVVAQLAPEVNYRTFGYGVVLLWALLLASRPRRWPLKLLLGAVALMPLQSISLCFQWLKDALLASGPQVLVQTGLPRWSLEVVAYGYQFGFLMLTPLAPVLLWLLLDRSFVQRLWLEMTLAGRLERTPES
ncbi:exosortase H-associated membrane protein [Hydrogenophaga sp. OTU3427]|uniref:exosortase H-associated membrane protein n=1 Tax=Hydrogenophaga sp. OTU3427 TaxID=3043856 RepID=UPI00313DDC8C